MHCVDFFSFLSGSFEDRAIFHVIQLSFDGGGTYVPITDIQIREKCPYLDNYHSKKRSTWCLILLFFLFFSQLKFFMVKYSQN